MSEEHYYMVTISSQPLNPRKTFIPPLRFATVERDVYRGSYPRPLNFPFLETLKLKTILSLTPAPLIEPVAKWCKEKGIVTIHCPPDKSGKKSIPLSHQDAKRAIEIILFSDHSPIYVHCLNGSEATGLVMACLRKLQFWAPQCILSELQRFSELHNSFEAFLEGFIEEIEIPEKSVEWLWQGMKDSEGVIGRHRVGVRYKNSELEKRRIRRLAREEEGRSNGTLQVELNGSGEMENV
ncbi:tyrosine phosphatase family-domain-containing protein [Kalaharituber pfeilii]|nr:tyrosine phosphatase family-domain-containing protein [Kalaharituber pfeilii]